MRRPRARSAASRFFPTSTKTTRSRNQTVTRISPRLTKMTSPRKRTTSTTPTTSMTRWWRRSGSRLSRPTNGPPPGPVPTPGTRPPRKTVATTSLQLHLPAAATVHHHLAGCRDLGACRIVDGAERDLDGGLPAQHCALSLNQVTVPEHGTRHAHEDPVAGESQPELLVEHSKATDVLAHHHDDLASRADGMLRSERAPFGCRKQPAVHR